MKIKVIYLPQKEMANLTEEFKKIPIDWALWEKFYHKNQQSYLLKRLDAISLLWQGHSRYAICDENLQYAVLSSWIKMYLTPDIDDFRLPKNVKKQDLSPNTKLFLIYASP